MKKIHLIMILPAFLLLACADWLNIQPALETRENEMFANESGFKNVLTGAYIRVAKPELYGRNMTMTLPEAMTGHWKAVDNSLLGYLKNFNFEEKACKDLLETIWLEYYQTIANLNILLASIDDRVDLFTNGNHALIKGEALGLRAFLHLEVLRLWGDVPGNITPDAVAIPYVTKVTKDPNDLGSISYREFSRHLLADLDSAERLLANDPITLYSNDILNAPGGLVGYEENRPEDPFHYYRQSRFNYYAVKATKARYHHWMGDPAVAASLAAEIIDAVNTSTGSSKFTLADERLAQSGKMTFPTEHIFAVHNSLAQQTVNTLFLQHSVGYTQDSVLLRDAYERATQASDIRFRDNRLWQTRLIQIGSSYNFFKKYVVDDRTAVDVVPVIRLAEMYFIAIENGDAGRFPAYRIARNLYNGLDAELTSPQAILDRLEKEYRKEFYGEGQMFYFYKRHDYASFPWPENRAINTAQYKLPRPEAQTLFE
ncbi:MAG: RagB/SusD family nutrient uptake outer membrane protein [Odoribacteraceae bacterium]|jgi:hypothetical protein|nr:RagB/SusD family nutrient uptake outer membrane protein [Odoribacteraceae bacterium]